MRWLLNFRDTTELKKYLGRSAPTPSFEFISHLQDSGLLHLEPGYPLTWMGVPVQGDTKHEVRYFIVLINKNKRTCKHFSPTDADVVTHLGSWLWARCEFPSKSESRAVLANHAKLPFVEVEMLKRYRTWANVMNWTAIISSISAISILTFFFIEPNLLSRIPSPYFALVPCYLLLRFCRQQARDYEAGARQLLDEHSQEFTVRGNPHYRPFQWCPPFVPFPVLRRLRNENGDLNA